jgi:hypothetical protein
MDRHRPADQFVGWTVHNEVENMVPTGMTMRGWSLHSRSPLPPPLGMDDRLARMRPGLQMGAFP